MARHGARTARYRERYEEVILRTKPVLYVPMQGGSMKELVKGSAITEGNGPLRYSGFAPGVESRRFSDSTADNDYLEVTTNDNTYHPGDTFSVGGWFNRLAAGATTFPTIMHNGDSPANDFLVAFSDNTPPDTLILRLAGTGQAFTTAKSFGSTDGWHHVIFVHVGNPTTCYIDGLPDTGTSANRTFGSGTAVKPLFGITPGLTSNDFAGALAHWATWNRGLTAGEIRELYVAGLRQT